MTYNIGDRVRFIGEDSPSLNRSMAGDRGTVRFLDAERDDIVHVEFDGGLDWRQWPVAVLVTEIEPLDTGDNRARPEGRIYTGGGVT